MALYPPGSTFKPLIGLIALDEGVQQADYTVPCNGLYHIAGLSLKCSHRHPTATNIEYALNQSCNPYFWQSFRNTLENKDFNTIQESYGQWTAYCKSFQLGAKTGVDLPSEKNGNIPSVKYFNKIYGEKGWRAATIISLGIGQGEVLVTPLQLCNLYAAIANKGFYYTPHVVKHVAHPENNKSAAVKTQKHYTRVNPVYFSRVIDGLESVMISGTARLSAIPGIAVCGKTGTVQNPHGKDHAIFCGFAPKENPKIAIAVIVENSGFGGVYAAPIASLLLEKYLNDTISSSRLPIIEKMKNTDLIHSSSTPSISPH
jgi:penicillin-binding protein 2